MNFNKGDKIFVKVKPNSSLQKLKYDEKDNILVAFLKSPPIENKANKELIKLFKKELKLNIEIVSGFTSKKKLIKII